LGNNEPLLCHALQRSCHDRGILCCSLGDLVSRFEVAGEIQVDLSFFLGEELAKKFDLQP
jgi:hypothetical protein